MISASLVAATLFAPALPPTAEVVVKRGSYRQFREAYSLSNGLVEAVVVPQIGRIIAFRFVGERNVLWENPQVESDGYRNWGGDKVWPGPQSLWNWPPPTSYDGKPYRVTRLGDSLMMRSETSSEGFRIARRITMDPLKPRILVENTIESFSASTVSRSIWQIAQITVPDHVRFLGETASVENYRDRPAPSGQVVPGRAFTAVQWHPTTSFKVGSRNAQHRLVAVYNDAYLSLSASDLGPGPFPDFFPLQVFSSANPTAYMELELAGTIRNIRPGGSASYTSILELERRDQD